MKFDQLCTVISLLQCTSMHVLALYYFFLIEYLNVMYREMMFSVV